MEPILKLLWARKSVSSAADGPWATCGDSWFKKTVSEISYTNYVNKTLQFKEDFKRLKYTSV